MPSTLDLLQFSPPLLLSRAELGGVQTFRRFGFSVSHPPLPLVDTRGQCRLFCLVGWIRWALKPLWYPCHLRPPFTLSASLKIGPMATGWSGIISLWLLARGWLQHGDFTPSHFPRVFVSFFLSRLPLSIAGSFSTMFHTIRFSHRYQLTASPLPPSILVGTPPTVSILAGFLSGRSSLWVQPKSRPLGLSRPTRPIAAVLLMGLAQFSNNNSLIQIGAIVSMYPTEKGLQNSLVLREEFFPSYMPGKSSTSQWQMTTLRLSGLAVKTLLTHSRLVSNLLFILCDDLSFLYFKCVIFYCSVLKGWLIPSM